MPHLRDLFSRFEEASYELSYEVIPSESIDIKEDTIIYLLKFEEKNPLFEIQGKAIRLKSERSINIIPCDPPKFNYIFLLTSRGNSKYILSCLEIHECQPLENELVICFGDDFVNRNIGKPMSQLEKYLYDNLVFIGDKYSFVFVQEFTNGPHWNLLSLEMVANGQLKDNKEILHKTTRPNRTSKVRFPKDSYEFSQLSVRCYKSISFKNESQIKISLERLSTLDQKGQSLLKLWESYASIELKRSQDRAQQLGEIKFTKVRSLPNHQVEVLLDILPEKEHLLSELSKNGALFEVQDEETRHFFKLERYISSRKTAIFDDELFKMPVFGLIHLSFIGDEVVKKRRDYALGRLREQSSPLLAYLWEVMEGKPTMQSRNPSKSIISQSTRDFMRNQFHISNLTEDQETAINLALQTPDIIAIQGPPGTGKTTVVSAICHRLVELAEKEKTSKSKLILASAFQNDTVEHIASKIYTEGLPTVKLGKTSQSISAVSQFVDGLDNSISNELRRLNPDGISFTISEQIRDIYEIYVREKNLEETCSRINDFLQSSHFDSDLESRWESMSSTDNFVDRRTQRVINKLQGLSIDVKDYSDSSYCSHAAAIVAMYYEDLLSSTEKEVVLNMNSLEVPPIETIYDFILIKDRLLDQLGNNDSEKLTYENVLNWLLDAVEKAQVIDTTTTGRFKEVYYYSVLNKVRNSLKGSSRMIEEALRHYGVSIAATNQISSRLGFDLGQDKVRNVVLEEAARSNPLDLIIPMTKATERIILLGDQMQLPHLLELDLAEQVIDSLEEEASVVDEKQELLKKSLFGIIFENLSDVLPRRCIMLTKQFRMHPAIGTFISQTYYQGKLENGVSAKERSHNLPAPWAGKAIAFVDVKGSSFGYEDRGQSKYRLSEVKKVMEIAESILESSHNLSVGIITFYSAQVRELMKAGLRKGYTILDKEGNYIISPLYASTSDGRERLRIGSVDSFQGKEFDVVILSTVRSNNIERKKGNEKRAFGFLLLENRLNVAFSRSIRLLITVGDADMFSDDFAQTYVKGLYELCTHQTRLQYGIFIK